MVLPCHPACSPSPFWSSVHDIAHHLLGQARDPGVTCVDYISFTPPSNPLWSPPLSCFPSLTYFSTLVLFYLLFRLHAWPPSISLLLECSFTITHLMCLFIAMPVMDLEFNFKFLMTLTSPSGLQVPVQLPWLCCLTLMVHGFTNVGFVRGLHGGQSRPQSSGLNTILPVQGWILEPVPAVGMVGRTYIQRTEEGWAASFCLGPTHRSLCGSVLSMTFYRWPATMVSFTFSERGMKPSWVFGCASNLKTTVSFSFWKTIETLRCGI